MSEVLGSSLNVTIYYLLTFCRATQKHYFVSFRFVLYSNENKLHLLISSRLKFRYLFQTLLSKKRIDFTTVKANHIKSKNDHIKAQLASTMLKNER
jgi:hypothetical protein